MVFAGHFLHRGNDTTGLEVESPSRAGDFYLVKLWQNGIWPVNLGCQGPNRGARAPTLAPLVPRDYHQHLNRKNKKKYFIFFYTGTIRDQLGNRAGGKDAPKITDFW